MTNADRLAVLVQQMNDDPAAAREIVALLDLRVSHTLSDGTTVVALTVQGLDLYVSRSGGGDRLAVSVGIDDLPDGVTAVVEANDGMSWEQPLP